VRGRYEECSVFRTYEDLDSIAGGTVGLRWEEAGRDASEED